MDSIGAPGSGKGTICSFLAHKYSLLHFSVGDNLRTWMRANGGTPLAARIQEKLDHQGFLTSAELNPILGHAIEDAIRQGGFKGILIDGFPRCMEQLESWAQWPFQGKLHLVCSNPRRATGRLIGPGEIITNELTQEGSNKPDAVISINVTRDSAKSRYLARARDRNDSAVKFQRRYDEYLKEGRPVEEHYRDAGLIIDVSPTGLLGKP